MGNNESQFPNEPWEVIEQRSEQSKLFHLKRQRGKQVYTSMIHRIIEEKPALSQSPRTPRNLFGLFPNDVIFLILKFSARDIHMLLQVSALWHTRILEAIDQAFNQIESSFVLVHSHLLSYQRGYMSTSQIQTSYQSGIRCDRVFVAEPLPILEGYTIKLRYTYRVINRPNTYKTEFKFDCIPKGSRSVWVHKDEGKFHGDDSRRAYSPQIPQIHSGDFLEFALNWLNLQGMVDLNSVDWQPPLIQDTKGVLRSLQLAPKYKGTHTPQEEIDTIRKKLYLYNISRHCEVELTQTEWYEHLYFTNQKEVYVYNHFEPFLTLEKCDFAGVDIIVSRNVYRAMRPGVIPGSQAKIGVQVEVVPKNKITTVEVKRMGLMFDRHRPVQLRVGETFVLYITRGGN